jgi:hypothetical protein
MEFASVRWPCLILERFGIFQEFLIIFFVIPDEYSLSTVALKSSIEVAEPLPRVYLDRIQEIVAISPRLNSCCTLVAPCLRW